MRSYILVPLLLLLAPGCSRPARQVPATGGGAAQARMDYRDFADVQGRSNPGAPLRMETSRIGGGGSMTSFVVAAPWHGFAPGQTFRDGAHIAADEAARKGSATKLKAELHAWNLLLKDSPVILTQADLEPKCQAHLSGNNANTPAISQTFTATGTEKFARFTKDHTGDVLGIIVDDHVLSAPIIMEPIVDGQAQISGGFASLNEAHVLANRLNEAAESKWKP